MSEIDTIFICIVILAYGVVCYLMGKGDLLNLIPKMLLAKAKEYEEELKESEEE